MADRSKLLTLKNIEMAFGGIKAVAGVNLELERTGITSLIGGNGAGKSTLFKLISGQLIPTRGDIYYGGVNITQLASFRRARLGIGIKNQMPDLLDDVTVRESLWLSIRNGKLREGEEYIYSVAEAVDIVHLLDSKVGLLAHGQRQLVEIGMVVAQDPELVLLDEPTAGMSVDETDNMAELIRGLSAKRAVLVVEHDMRFIENLGGRVIIFHYGEILKEGDYLTISSDPEVREIYLGRG